MHLRGSLLEAVRVHGGHDVDARAVDELHDGLVALLVLVAQVLGQVDQQLPAHRLVPMHVANVLKLWLPWELGKEKGETQISNSNTYHTVKP